VDQNEIKYFVEAALLAAGRPLSIDQLHNLFDRSSAPEKSQLREAITSLQQEYEHRGLTVSEVASGFRTQIRSSMADRLQKLWEERPPRYSRAFFETLALVAYRQPMTRGEIEEIRGVAVSSNIIRSLLEREWIRVVGHRDVPGRPAMFGTTRQFLDYFGLKKLDDLPPLADLADWETLRVQLNLPEVSEDEPEPESAEIMDLPVLYPEDGVEDATELTSDKSGVVSMDDGDDDKVDANSRGFQSMPVTRWPGPAEVLRAVGEKPTHAGGDEGDDQTTDHRDRDALISGR
jgi:segregation and condensation protein B